MISKEKFEDGLKRGNVTESPELVYWDIIGNILTRTDDTLEEAHDRIERSIAEGGLVFSIPSPVWPHKGYGLIDCKNA